MPSYSDRTIIKTDDMGDFGTSITYSIVNDQVDISGISYYGAGETNNFATGSSYIAALNDLVTRILSGDPSNTYSVTFSDIATVTFVTTDANSNGTFDAGEAVGEMTFAQARSSYAGFGGVTGASAVTGSGDSATGNVLDTQGDVWINADHQSTTWTNKNIWKDGGAGNHQAGGAAYIVLMHEIGHALGLKHPADGSAIDNQKYTIMSYVPLGGAGTTSNITDRGPMIDTGSIEDSAFAKGLQLYDIAALQETYGRNYTTRNTATTYSKATAFASGSAHDAFIYTIWDGGGTDTIDTSGYSQAAKIDLRQGMFSSIGADVNGDALFVWTANANGTPNITRDVGNVAVAWYTTIENAIGGAGDDVLIGNAWNNRLEGGAGHDLIYGDGQVYIDQTVGDNFIGGTNPAAPTDGSGVDTIFGGDGNDRIYGGAGNDVLHGNLGNDIIADGAGQDVVKGWEGDDTFIAYGNIQSASIPGFQTDLLHGGAYLNGSSGTELAFATDGFDTVDFSTLAFGVRVGLEATTNGYAFGYNRGSSYGAFSTFGSMMTLRSIESAIGTAQKDYFKGGIANALFKGGGSSDVFIDGAGNDIMYGEDGDDIFEIGRGGQDYLYGGAGTDTVYFNTGSSNLTIRDLSTGTYRDEKGLLNYNLDSVESIQFVSGSNGGMLMDYLSHNFDFLLGTYNGTYDYSHANVSGEFVFDYRAGSPLFEGKYGKFGSIQHDYIFATESPYRSTMWGSNHGDHIEFFLANSHGIIFHAGSGNDHIESWEANGPEGTGVQVIYHGGNDVIENGYVFGAIRLWEGISYGDLTITEQIISKANGIKNFNLTITIANHGTLQINNMYVYQQWPNDFLTEIKLDSGGQVKLGYDTNTFQGTGTIFTTLKGTWGDDALFAHAGLNETFYGKGGNDRIVALDGNDILYGGDGNDLLEGGAGNDTLNGASGNDIFVYTNGIDIFEGAGNSGVDTVRLDTVSTLSASSFVITGSNLDIFTGTGTDKITLNSYQSFEWLQFGTGAKIALTPGSWLYATGTTPFNGTGGDDTILGDMANNTVSGGLGSDIVFSAGGTDTLNGNDGNDTLDGGAANDTLYGGNHDDVLYGGDGNDTLYGGAGNDRLHGGLGTDTLYGEANSDTFVFEAASAFTAVDTVSDFSTAQGDKLNIADLLTGYTPGQSAIDDFVTFTASGGNTSFAVDRDGAGTTYADVTIASLTGVTGLDAQTLLNNGLLIAA